MNITLYANCIVNPNYDEVFADTDTLDKHLLSLDKYEAELPYMFVSYTGTLQFEYDRNFFDNQTHNVGIMECSYLKITSAEDEEPTKVYAFINHIELINGICILTYTADIWHTYLYKWTFRDGLLTRTLMTTTYQIKEKEYPFTIFGTNNIGIKNIKNNNSELLDECYIFATLQLYELQSGSDTKVNRITQAYKITPYKGGDFSKLFKFASYYVSGGQTYKYDEMLTLNGAINELISGQSSEHLVQWDETGKTMYYDITNVYLMPKDALRIEDQHRDNKYYFEIKKQTDTNYGLWASPFDIGDHLLYTAEIACDYKNLSVGLFTNKFELQNNGLNEVVNIKCIIRPDEIFFYLLLDNRIIDITENFRYDLPWQGVTAEALAQRSIALELQNSQIETESINAGINIAKSGVNAVAGTITGVASTLTGNINGIVKGFSGTLNGALDIGKGVNDLIFLSDKEKAANAEKYANSKANECSSQSVINAKYGICLFSIVDGENYSNYQETQKKLQQVGYKVSHYTNEIFFENTVEHLPYDIIKFDFVRISGLPTDLNNAIKQILLNGTKMWYTNVVNSNV